MIRYDVTEEALRAGITATSKTWLKRAETATEKLIEQTKYAEIGPSWSDIKTVYMTAQWNKCAYCERLLPPEETSTREQDVEHFRPKSRVRKWPKNGSSLKYDFATGGASSKGYYWLAYHPLNYCTACKTCNQEFKSDYFPVSAARGPLHGEPDELHAAESPLLIYPLGDLDTDPEQVLGFRGITPVARGEDEAQRRRAQVTIDFFGLAWREELLRERFEVIDRMYGHLRLLEIGNQADKAWARERLAEMEHDSASHANCARSYRALFEENPIEAWELREGAKGLLPDRLHSE